MTFLTSFIEREILRRSPSRERKERVKKMLSRVGYSTQQSMRVVPYEICFELVSRLNPCDLDVLEISGGEVTWRQFPFRSYTQANFPEFDICRDELSTRFDLIIADNVFEHLAYPYRAGRNVHSMLNPSGYFLNITPFLVKVHPCPIDCCRWTPVGMTYFLEECGFEQGRIQSGGWGNRACVSANFDRWRRQGWYSSRRNEPEFPLQVWALAQK